MKSLSLMVFFAFGFFLQITPSFAHMYDSIGVEAAPHDHGPQSVEDQFEDNCFIDPVLGPICK
tara:strand:- start:46 stop:234 length:189 start_codon:yes stop_codon:yes gene_type:complete